MREWHEDDLGFSARLVVWHDCWIEHVHIVPEETKIDDNADVNCNSPIDNSDHCAQVFMGQHHALQKHGSWGQNIGPPRIRCTQR